MKILHFSILIGSIVAIILGTVTVIETFFQNPPHDGYIEIQTDTIQNNTHTCSSKQLQIYDPGPMGGFMCPIISFDTYTKVNNNSGFDEVCLDKRYNAGNFVLKAGHTGSIVYTIYSNLPLAQAIKFPHINITNNDHFSHYKSVGPGYAGFTYTDSLKGVTVSFEPKYETLWPWSSILVNASISSTVDAETGSHWLFLSPGVCSGGPGLILTIENSSSER